MPDRHVPFSRAPRVPGEDAAINQVLATGNLIGGGAMTRRAQEMLESMTGSGKALLTTSGTSALEMACLLLELKPGDEVILPSFTFSSCANAIALRGAVPVFVDIRPDTLNLDESLMEGALSARTRAIMPVHYAGVAAEMNPIMEIARSNGLAVIEDAAQAIGALYNGIALGSIGDFGAFSFHGTKNISCGEGGCLLINDERCFERAEILWEKGTNRSQFIRGDVDKYTWVDLGSSFLPSEITAALLVTQLEHAKDITTRRRAIWSRYHDALEEFEAVGLLRRPSIPDACEGNAHIYSVIMPNSSARAETLSNMKARGVSATFHYVPLHSSPAGKRLGRTHGDMRVTDDLSSRLLRLPLYADITRGDQDYVIDCLRDSISRM